MTGHKDTEALALGQDVLLWIAGDALRTEAFLHASGSSIADMRDRANDPEFLGFVLDHLTQGDEALLEFCAAHDQTPQDVLRARANLPGGVLPNWT